MPSKLVSIRCKECYHEILETEISEHKNTFECDHNIFEDTLSAIGWVISEGDIRSTLNLTKKVDFALCPVNQGNQNCIWVKPWVISAIKSFDNMDGFADMSLHEYLDKVATSTS